MSARKVVMGVFGYPRFIAVIICSLLSFDVVLASNDAFSIAPLSPIINDHFNTLLKKAQSEGKVRVIVKLNSVFTPEGKHSIAKNVVEQRTNISRLQKSLLKSLLISDETKIKKFKYIPFMAMEVDEAILSSLAANSIVDGISEDELRRPILWDTIPLIGANSGEAADYSGAGQTIAILDTGVETTHPFLSSKIVQEACFSSGPHTLCPNGQTSQIGTGAAANCLSAYKVCRHGTHVAGIAAGKRTEGTNGAILRGVAPDANIIAVQVFHGVDDTTVCSPDPAPCVRTYDSDYTLALEHVYELRNSYRIASVNMSLGERERGYPSFCDNANISIAMVKAQIDNLRSVGIGTIIASGNDGYSNAISAPACISSAVSVGATRRVFLNIGQMIASYSNSASFLSLLAPGGAGIPILDDLGITGIYSSVPSYDNYWGNMSGTSMAAPHVAGAWALLKQKYPSASVDRILTALQSTGIPVTDTRTDQNGVATNITKRRIQVDAALNALPALPNLTPNIKTDSDVIYPTDDIHISWAAVNNGQDNVMRTFYTKLYIDDIEKVSWPTASLNVGYLIYVNGYNLGKLSSGIHTIKVITDATNTALESDESDNEYSITITVLPPRPDLIITAVSGPTTAKVRKFIKVTNTVKNQGTARAGAFKIGLYLSVDNIIDPATDRFLGNWKKSGLAVNSGSTAALRLRIPTDVSPGTYYLGVVADPSNTVLELNEANNAKATPISIQAR